jgi:hypothetical protein
LVDRTELFKLVLGGQAIVTNLYSSVERERETERERQRQQTSKTRVGVYTS